jgi:hypothetical protein
MLRDQNNGSLRPLISGFLDLNRYYFFQIALQAEWFSFETNYYSENLVAPKIEPETSRSVARNSDQ